MDKIYLLCREAATNKTALIRTLNGGSSWETLQSNIHSQANGGSCLSATGSRVYFAAAPPSTSYTNQARFGMYDTLTDTAYLINGNTQLGWGQYYYATAIYAVDDTNVYLTVYRANVGQLRLYHFNGNWASATSGDFTLLGYSRNATYSWRNALLTLAADDMYISYRWNGQSFNEARSCLYHFDGVYGYFTRDAALGSAGNRQCLGIRKHPTSGDLIICTTNEVDSKLYLYKGTFGGPWTELFSTTNYYASAWLPDDNNIYIDPSTEYVYCVYRRNSGGLYLLTYNGSTVSEDQITSSGTTPYFPKPSGPNANDLIIPYGNSFWNFNGSVWTETALPGDYSIAQSIQWVGDSTDPVIQNRDPADSETDVAADSNFQFEVVDPDTGIEASTVIIQVKHGAGGSWIDAWTGDAAQSGYAVTKTAIADGFRYEVNPDANFPYETEIFIRVYAENGDGGSVDETVSFTTEDYPFIIDSIDIDKISNGGGIQITATGTFLLNQNLSVYCGVNQNQTDAPCYGLSGNGYTAVSEDGETIVFVTPPLDFVGAAYFTFVYEAKDYSFSQAITVYEKNKSNKREIMARSFPHWINSR